MLVFRRLNLFGHDLFLPTFKVGHIDLVREFPEANDPHEHPLDELDGSLLLQLMEVFPGSRYGVYLPLTDIYPTQKQLILSLERGDQVAPVFLTVHSILQPHDPIWLDLPKVITIQVKEDPYTVRGSIKPL